MHSLTCRRVLKQLLELSRRQLCACHGHDHSNLRELDFDVGLLQIAEQCGGRDALGGAIGRTLHHVNNHLGPERFAINQISIPISAQSLLKLIREP